MTDDQHSLRWFRLHDQLYTLLDPFLAQPATPQTYSQAYLVFAVTKAFKTQQAILLLCRNGFGQDAAVLARVLCELVIDALYIAQDPEPRSQQFKDYDWISRERMYRVNESNPSLVAAIQERAASGDSNIHTIEHIRQEAQRVKATYAGDTWKKGWSGKSLATMAREVGREDHYNIVYRLHSKLAHSEASAARDYFVRAQAGDEGDLELAPDSTWVEQTLVASFELLIHLADSWRTEFQHPISEQIDKLAQDSMTSPQSL